MYSKVVVDMVKAGGSSNAFFKPLLDEIIWMLKDPGWRTSIVHSYRETNFCADFLAKKGHEATSFDWVIVEDVCPSLGILLANDVRDSVLTRVAR